MIKRTRSAPGTGICVAAAVCGLLVVGCNNAEESTRQAPPPGGGPGGGGPGRGPGGPGGRGGAIAANATPAEIYQQKCQFCHGANGAGARGPALASAAGKSETDLTKTIHDGRGKMPAFGQQLSQAQITALAGYVKQLASGK